jgi:hypothetical protein
MKERFTANDFDESDKPFEAQCGACGLRHNIQWPVDATCLPASSEPLTEDMIQAEADRHWRGNGDLNYQSFCAGARWARQFNKR